MWDGYGKNLLAHICGCLPHFLVNFSAKQGVHNFVIYAQFVNDIKLEDFFIYANEEWPIKGTVFNVELLAQIRVTLSHMWMNSMLERKWPCWNRIYACFVATILLPQLCWKHDILSKMIWRNLTWLRPDLWLLLSLIP